MNRNAVHLIRRQSPTGVGNKINEREKLFSDACNYSAIVMG